MNPARVLRGRLFRAQTLTGETVSGIALGEKFYVSAPCPVPVSLVEIPPDTQMVFENAMESQMMIWKIQEIYLMRKNSPWAKHAEWLFQVFVALIFICLFLVLLFGFNFAGLFISCVVAVLGGNILSEEFKRLVEQSPQLSDVFPSSSFTVLSASR